METDQSFQLYLAKYQGLDLGTYITFMIYLRIFLIAAKPNKVITIQNVNAVNIIDLLIPVLLDHEPHDVPWYEPFSYLELADLHNDYLEKEAVKGKGALIQAIWNVHAIPKLYSLAYKAWRRHGPQDLTSGTELAQAVLDGCYGQKWLDTVFQVPDSCVICLSPMHWARKDALWSYVSHALPVTTPGREQHLSTLQGTHSIESTLDAVLSPPNWENDYSVIILPFFLASLYAKIGTIKLAQISSCKIICMG
ncbi:hypothetical protein TNCV_1420401 [Trichonephila clavipes]|nr:hypothetical protein TNCV_1420401 [Trichonephila clavipes]